MMQDKDSKLLWEAYLQEDDNDTFNPGSLIQKLIDMGFEDQPLKREPYSKHPEGDVQLAKRGPTMWSHDQSDTNKPYIHVNIIDNDAYLSVFNHHNPGITGLPDITATKYDISTPDNMLEFWIKVRDLDKCMMGGPYNISGKPDLPPECGKVSRVTGYSDGGNV
jgi:hypothetical protein